MHKMLEVYLENYLNDITRDNKLNEIKEYKEIYDELNELEHKVRELLTEVVGKSEAYDLASKFNELNWYITKYEIQDAFELGFNAGLQIGIDSYNKIKEE